MARVARVAFVLLSALAMGGCPDSTSPTLPPATPGGGWIISTYLFNNGLLSPAPSSRITGTWAGDGPSPQGSAEPIDVTTNDLALAPVLNGRVPATWNLIWQSSIGDAEACAGHGATAKPSFVGVVEDVGCFIGSVGAGTTFSFNPNPLGESSPPSEATITGEGFSSAYGMPLVQYYGLDGTLVDQENATSVSQDGTSISGPVGDISQLPAGTYVGIISNAGSGGSWNYVGTVGVSIMTGAPGTGSVTITGAEQSVWYDPCAQYYYDISLYGDCTSYNPPYWTYDTGVVDVIVNGVGCWANYGQNDNNATVASSLASAINSCSPYVSASVSGATIYLTARATGTATNYSLFEDAYSDYSGSPSFYVDTSGSALVGGLDGPP